MVPVQCSCYSRYDTLSFWARSSQSLSYALRVERVGCFAYKLDVTWFTVTCNVLATAVVAGEIRRANCVPWLTSRLAVSTCSNTNRTAFACRLCVCVWLAEQKRSVLLLEDY